jgi:hypothetical protein
MNILFGNPFETVPGSGSVLCGGNCNQQEYFNFIYDVSFTNYSLFEISKV